MSVTCVSLSQNLDTGRPQAQRFVTIAAHTSLQQAGGKKLHLRHVRARPASLAGDLAQEAHVCALEGRL